ncbi:hypothetical protein GX865_00705 [Candidatus Saccharibacteria bacterium]|jgi:hypothetical protein|nr:hypothetical protein [Candidatus Saccharibacteria bacterium]
MNEDPKDIKDDSTEDNSLNRQVEKIESLEKDEPIIDPDEIDSSSKELDDRQSSKADTKGSSGGINDTHKPSQRLADLVSEGSVVSSLKEEEKAEKLRKIKASLNNDKKSKGSKLVKVGLVATSFLTLVGFGLAAWFYFNLSGLSDDSANIRGKLSEQEKTYNKRIDDLKQKHTKEISDLKSKSKNEISDAIKIERGYRYIPELGVRYKINDTNKDLVFSLEVLDNGSGSANERLLISTKQLSLERTDKSPGNTIAYSCGPSSGAAGAFVRLSKDEYAKAKESSGVVAKQLGDSYVVWIGTGADICGGSIADSQETVDIRSKVDQAKKAAESTVKLLEEYK